MLSRPDAARLGFLVQVAMDMHVADRAALAPAPDARLAPAWRIAGYLAGSDTLYRRGQPLTFGSPTCYGYLAQRCAPPFDWVVVIRGTDGLTDWIEDAIYGTVEHSSGGHVEAGFDYLYRSLRLVAPDGEDSGPSAFGVAAQLTAAIGPHENVTVAGHSLGAAVATLLAYDLAADSGPRVSACLLASPKVGDATFGLAFDTHVADYAAYSYSLDAVPHVPLGAPFADLPRLSWLHPQDAQARIRFDLACHHHVLCYCAMLAYDLADWHQSLPLDTPEIACIRGPASA